MNDNHDLRRQSGKGNDTDITIHLKMKKINTCNKKHWITGGCINDGLVLLGLCFCCAAFGFVPVINAGNFIFL